MVTLARESRGLTQKDLGVLMGVPQGTISKIESGTLAVTQELAKEISSKLEYPLGFFEQADIVHPFGSSTFYHRKQQSVPAGVLRQIEAKINIYRFQISRLLRATDLDTRCRFRRYNLDEVSGGVEEIAQLVRAAWRAPAGPIRNLTRMIEDAGGVVVRFEFGTNQMYGLSEWVPPAPPIFFLNKSPEISADRDRFTLAHELGHIFLHTMPNPHMEDEANKFASAFLMPEEDIRPHLITPIRLHTVARLKPFWKVSMAALIQRARDLGVINENQFVYLRIQLQKLGYRKKEPPELDIKREEPTLLPEIIDAHITDLGFGLSDLALAVNMNPGEFRSYHAFSNADRVGLRLVKS